MYKCKLQAHRGVSSDYPENTMPAFHAAVREGYDVIEFDPKMTCDHVPVVLHDRTLDRTGRIAGSPIEGETRIDRLEYRQLCDVDVGIWKDSRFAGTHIPTLSQALDYMKSVKTEAKIDNVIQTFSDYDVAKIFDTVRRHGEEELVGFTFSDLDMLARTAELFPKAPLHYDGEVTDEKLALLKKVAAGHKTYVWMRFDNALTSWNKNPAVSERFSKLIKRDFLLGVWILESNDELRQAACFEPDIVETTGAVKPVR